MRNKILLVSATLLFCCALLFLFYPLLSNLYYEAHQSQLHTQLLERVDNTDATVLEEMRMKAQEYNQALLPGASAFSKTALESALQNYTALLDLNGTGVMGYLCIPKLDVKLPIYHGTADSTLELGIGHLLGSSLPVGGESCHTVLTGHSGLASQRMLSDLPQMEVGDLFYLEVLGEVLAYEVDQIKTVLPHDTTYLSVTEGEDQCTLVTCTPMGINTHRLLVRGSRVAYMPEVEMQVVSNATTESDWGRQYRQGVVGGLALVAVSGLAFAVTRVIVRRRRGGS